MSLKQVESHTCFGGRQEKYEHDSAALGCTMRFSIYLPPGAGPANPVPVLYWLSGLTCTDDNFVQKAGAQRIAAELGMAVVAPDTSPRGEDVPDDPAQAYDLGLGAGFYVNATQSPWDRHYRMYDYVVSELPTLIEAQFPVDDRRAISGHSMGGHGALVAALRNPDRYRSASAFAPIGNPASVPWGHKAFTAYLGDDQQQWREYDASELIRDSRADFPILVDQGAADTFLEEQLKPDTLKAAAQDSSHPFELRVQPGYDHSYFFIASFIEEHLRFHARYLASA